MGLQVPLSLPAGSVAPYAGSNAPAGWLFMYGQAVSRATYAALFLAIGTTYGAGDGSTTFNLPDARGRALFGRDDMGGAAANRVTAGGSGLNGVALGAVGGAETVTLSAAQMPSHAHTQNAHTHQQSSAPGTPMQIGSAGGVSTTAISVNMTTAGGRNALNTAVDTQAATPTEQTQGSSGAHGNIPPSLILNYIIKT